MLQMVEPESDYSSGGFWVKMVDIGNHMRQNAEQMNIINKLEWVTPLTSKTPRVR